MYCANHGKEAVCLQQQVTTESGTLTSRPKLCLPTSSSEFDIVTTFAFFSQTAAGWTGEDSTRARRNKRPSKPASRENAPASVRPKRGRIDSRFWNF